jgi:hypothetical protein
MGRVSVGFVKARSWRLFADAADRNLLIVGLVGLGTVFIVYFIANGVFGMFETLGAAIKSAF